MIQDWPEDDLRLEMFTLLRLSEAREHINTEGTGRWKIGGVNVTKAINSLVRKDMIRYHWSTKSPVRWKLVLEV